MYDITDISSFESIPEIIESIKEEKAQNFPMILIGNKIDLKNDRIIESEEGEELAEKYGMDFIEVSNKEGINIEKLDYPLLIKFWKKEKMIVIILKIWM